MGLTEDMDQDQPRSDVVPAMLICQEDWIAAGSVWVVESR